MTTRAQRAADRVFLRGLDRWLEQLEESSLATTAVHERLALRITADLQGVPAAQVRRVIRRAFDAFERDRMRIIERAVVRAARTGSGMTPAVARAVFGSQRARRALRPIVDVAQSVARQHITGGAVEQTLRARLRTRTTVLVADMAAVVEESVVLSESTVQLSERLLAARDIPVRVPRYIEEVRTAARQGGPSAVRSTVRRQLARLQAGRIPEHDISRQTRRFLERVRRSGGADIDQAVDTWVRGRAQNQAMTISRTEGQSAMNTAYVESTRDQPWVVGMRWNLSPAHPKSDVCNVMASQDDHNLGGGGYPTGEVPALAHTNCLCFFTAITDESFLERELAERRGEPEPPRPWITEGGPSGREWLQGQPESVRRQILGPGRAREFERRPTRVVNSDGSFQPLYTIQGRPPPPLPAGSNFQHRPQASAGRLGQPRDEPDTTSS